LPQPAHLAASAPAADPTASGLLSSGLPPSGKASPGMVTPGIAASGIGAYGADAVSRARQWAARGDREDVDEIVMLVRGLRLATGEDGDLRLDPHQRNIMAAFREGLFLVARGQRLSVEVTTLVRTARALRIELWPPVEVDRTVLSLIYEEAAAVHGQRRGSGASLSRQQLLANILQKAAALNASDVQVKVLGEIAEIRVRVFGRMSELMPPIDAESGMAMINATFTVAEGTTSHANAGTLQQGALTPQSGRLPPSVDLVRLQYTPTGGGRGSLAMRLKYRAGFNEYEIDTLGYSSAQTEAIRTMRRRTNGMYLIAGKVSSGKTTTLQRVMNAMYREKHREISIFTIEEPVELEIDGAVQVGVTVTGREERSSVFAAAMNAALRSDPNVILVGELRDRETADLAVRAALSGHALWSSIHAGNALSILDRLSDLGVDRWKITDPTIVRGLVAQRLVGVMCPHCRMDLMQALRAGRITKTLGRDLCRLLAMPPASLFVRGDGCDHCSGGLIGRTVVAETLLTDVDLLDHYARDERREMREYWLRPREQGGMGGRPMLYHALLKVAAGILDVNEMEEEVDLLEVFASRFPFLVDPLRAEIAAANTTAGTTAGTTGTATDGAAGKASGHAPGGDGADPASAGEPIR